MSCKGNNSWPWEDSNIKRMDNPGPPLLVGGHWTEDTYEICPMCVYRNTEKCRISNCKALTNLHVHDTKVGTVISDIPSDDNRKVMHLGENSIYGNIWAYPRVALLPFTDDSDENCVIIKKIIKTIKNLFTKVSCYFTMKKPQKGKEKEDV